MAIANKVAIITGAGGGIGGETVECFVEAGFNVIAADASAEALTRFESLVVSRRVHPFVGDVSDQAFTQQLVQFAVDTYGGIDSVVPSAGIYTDAPFAELSDETWTKTMAINVDAVFHLLREAAPHLTDGSSIVTLTSIAADRGSVAHAHYSASKGAILSLTKTLAIELAPKTRVNSVAPGVIETQMTAGLVGANGEKILTDTPLARLGQAREVADVIAFLASPGASFVTGECIRVNGGLHIS